MTSPAAKPRILALRALLYVALLAAGVFAAYQVHVYWIRADDPAGPYASNRHSWREPSQTQGGTGAGTLLEDLWSTEGMTRLDGDPGGLAPPESVRRFTAFEQTSGALRCQFASYRFDGSGEDVLAHYRRLLESRGYQRVAGGGDEQGRRREEFIAGDRKVIVALLNETGDSRIGRLAVAVLEPMSPARPGE